MERPKRGQKLKARTLTDLQDRGLANTIISGPNMLVGRSPIGTSLEPDDITPPSTNRFWIQLTSANTTTHPGRYGWKYATRTMAGGWTVSLIEDGTLLLDWAFEANSFFALALPCFIDVARDIGTGQIVFQLEDCS